MSSAPTKALSTGSSRERLVPSPISGPSTGIPLGDSSVPVERTGTSMPTIVDAASPGHVRRRVEPETDIRAAALGTPIDSQLSTSGQRNSWRDLVTTPSGDPTVAQPPREAAGGPPGPPEPPTLPPPATGGEEPSERHTRIVTAVNSELRSLVPRALWPDVELGTITADHQLTNMGNVSYVDRYSRTATESAGRTLFVVQAKVEVVGRSVRLVPI